MFARILKLIGQYQCSKISPAPFATRNMAQYINFEQYVQLPIGASKTLIKPTGRSHSVWQHIIPRFLRLPKESKNGVEKTMPARSIDGLWISNTKTYVYRLALSIQLLKLNICI